MDSASATEAGEISDTNVKKSQILPYPLPLWGQITEEVERTGLFTKI
jgi:hypothetical protein